MPVLAYRDETVVGAARVSPHRATDGFHQGSEWSRDGHVIDAGEAVVRVPLLGLTVADVPGCSAVATLAASQEEEGELGFTLFGLSLSSGYTVSVDETMSLRCEAGRSARVELPLPVLWTLKGPPGSDEGLWVELEPVVEDQPQAIVALSVPPSGVPVASRHYTVEAGAPTLNIENEYRYEHKATFELKLDGSAIPIGAALTLGRTSAQTLGLSVSMAPGRDYLVSRWAGVAGGILDIE